MLAALTAMVIAGVLGTSGLIGGVWRVAGVLKRRADRLGVGALRAGLVVQRVRFTMLLWAAALAAVGGVLTVLMWNHTAVRVGAVLGAAFACVAWWALPVVAPRLLLGLLRVLRRRIPGRWTRTR